MKYRYSARVKNVFLPLELVPRLTLKEVVSKILWEFEWWIVLAIVVFSTVAFGGVHPPSIFAIRSLILSGFLVQISLYLFEKSDLSDRINSVLVPTSMFAGFLVLVWLQRSLGVKILEGSLIGSVNAHATKDAVFQLVFYFLFFF